MKILEFTTEQYGVDLLSICASNANLIGDTSSSLTSLIINTTNSKNLCYKDYLVCKSSCAGNEALNEAEIVKYISDGKCVELEKTNQQLIDEGYLPEPEIS
jgi:hypothetical protein